MRLLVGFCGHFAKATFSSLSIKKVEALEVRELVSVLDGWVLIPFFCSFCVSINEAVRPLSQVSEFCSVMMADKLHRSHCFCSSFLLISSATPRFFSSSYAFKELSMAVKQAAGFAERREERNGGS